MWSLESGISLVRQVAPIAYKHGFAVALYGGVLERGSGNDLNLFFVEQDSEICNVAACLDEIAALPALREHLRRLEAQAEEERDREAYTKKPQAHHEADAWEAEAAWPSLTNTLPRSSLDR